MNYKEQLLTKEWRAKRKEIRSRDQACQSCGSKENLQVHHTYYEYKMAWQYDSSTLYLLCDQCHEQETKDRKELKELVNEMLKNGIFAREIIELLYQKSKEYKIFYKDIIIENPLIRSKFINDVDGFIDWVKNQQNEQT